jgi:hypothetical protein
MFSSNLMRTIWQGQFDLGGTATSVDFSDINGFTHYRASDFLAADDVADLISPKPKLGSMLSKLNDQNSLTQF